MTPVRQHIYTFCEKNRTSTCENTTFTSDLTVFDVLFQVLKECGRIAGPGYPEKGLKVIQAMIDDQSPLTGKC